MLSRIRRLFSSVKPSTLHKQNESIGCSRMFLLLKVCAYMYLLRNTDQAGQEPSCSLGSQRHMTTWKKGLNTLAKLSFQLRFSGPVHLVTICILNPNNEVLHDIGFARYAGPTTNSVSFELPSEQVKSIAYCCLIPVTPKHNS